MFAWLVTLFSAFVLVLDCVGLKGAVPSSVTHRMRELGIRIALGADRLTVLRMFLGQAVIAAGLLIGLSAAWAWNRLRMTALRD